VYAMQRKREKMLEIVKTINNSDYKTLIRNRLDTYFREYQHDPELLDLLRR
jgi:hypothetical protein